MIWADNIFLVCSSLVEVVRRTREVEDVILKKKMYFNQSSLEILPNRYAEGDKEPIVLSDGRMFSWVAVLQVLSCFLDGVGSSETQVRGRLQQRRKMFNKLRPLLCESTGGKIGGVLYDGRG